MAINGSHCRVHKARSPRIDHLVVEYLRSRIAGSICLYGVRLLREISGVMTRPSIRMRKLLRHGCQLGLIGPCTKSRFWKIRILDVKRHLLLFGEELAESTCSSFRVLVAYKTDRKENVG